MINKKNIELFFDYIDQTAIHLFETNKISYLDGMNEAFNFLLDDEFEQEYTVETLDKVRQYKDMVASVDFQPEEVRKAVQLGLLRGYKHSNESNALITPDTIGIFISYLVEKCYSGKTINSILDPMVGTGNLLFTVINQLGYKVKAYGIDNDMLKCKLSRNLGDLLQLENEMFYQDTLTYYDYGFDMIVSDIEDSKDVEEYLPYAVVSHHLDALKDGGFGFYVIPNDFFEQAKNQVFKEEIQKKGYIFGLIKLSETLFKTSPKSILIIRKKGQDVRPLKDFLLVDLPSFNELEEMNQTINKMDQWFLSREEELK